MILIRNIIKRLKPYTGVFLFGTLLRILGDLCSLYPAYGLAQIINLLVKGEFLFSKILNILIIWCVLMVLRQFLLAIGKYYIHTIAEKVEVDVLNEGLEHIISLDASWHEEENTGNKLKRIQNGSDSYNNIVRIWINNIISIGVNFIGILYITSHTDKKVTIFIVFYIVVYFILTRILIAKIRIKSNLVNMADENAIGTLYEDINAVRTVKLLSLQEYILNKYREITEKVVIAMRNNIIWFQVRMVSGNVWTHVLNTFSIGFIVYGVIHGRYEIGFIALFAGYFSLIRESVSELSGILETIILAGQKIERYEDFKSIEIKTENNEGKIYFPTDWKEIIFKNVSFSYKDQGVLANINLTIKRGEKVGIVGLSGAGKSTLFKLLLKEREEYEGDIFIDNISLKNISPVSYREHIGVVLQDTEVFNMSLKDNITVGKKIDEKYFDNLLKIAHLEDITNKLKDGIHSLVGEKGIKLSGGEKQRLGIARALFKNPEILFLDEATSHLDIESEVKIKDSLHEAFSNITAIVIAHRLTTIREMDRIIVIEDGRIIEEGSFSVLQKKKGRFYDLWEKQKIM